MVSIGPNSQSYNFTHMFRMRDLRSPKQPPSYCRDSLMGIISRSTNFSKFKHMVLTAGLDAVLNDPQANFTMFVPDDRAIQGLGDGIFLNMDDATARHVVKASMLDRRITSDILESSRAAYYITKDPPNRLFITNIKGKTCVSNDVHIVQKDVQATNGVIHVVDKLLWPDMI